MIKDFLKAMLVVVIVVAVAVANVFLLKMLYLHSIMLTSCVSMLEVLLYVFLIYLCIRRR